MIHLDHGSLSEKPFVLCNYHRDHWHENNICQSLKLLVERLIKVGHLRRNVREIDYGVESGTPVNRITTGMAALSESRPAIKYILGGPSDD